MKQIFTLLRYRIPVSVFLVFLFCSSIGAQPCSPISITSATAVAAACPSGGSITIAATGTGLAYQLISGPTGYSTASNTTGVFGTLNAGNYVVEIRDACGVKTTRNLTVANTYPAFSVSTAATSDVCTSGVSGGTISGTVTGGKAPYQYAAVPVGNSPVYGTATASTSYSIAVSTFGTYRVYSKDNCGEVRTFDIMLHPTQPVPTDLWWKELTMDRPCGETMDGFATITWKLHLVDANGTVIGFNNLIGASWQIYKPVVANSISSSWAWLYRSGGCAAEFRNHYIWQYTCWGYRHLSNCYSAGRRYPGINNAMWPGI